MERGQHEERACIRRYFVRGKERRKSKDKQGSMLETPITRRFSWGTSFRTPEGGSGFVSSNDFGWVGRSLASRKSSVFLKFGMAVADGRESLFQPPKKRKKKAGNGEAPGKAPLPPWEEREEFQQKLEFQRLQQYFAKVDEFDLIEESPQARWKRLKTKRRKSIATPAPKPTSLPQELPPSGNLETREISLADAPGSEPRESLGEKESNPQSIAAGESQDHNPGCLRKSLPGEHTPRPIATGNAGEGEVGFDAMLTEPVQEPVIDELEGGLNSLELEPSNLGGVRDSNASNGDRWRASGEGSGHPSTAKNFRATIFEWRGAEVDVSGDAVVNNENVGAKGGSPTGGVDDDGNEQNRAENLTIARDSVHGSGVKDATARGEVGACRKSMLEIVVEEQHVSPMEHLLKACNQQGNAGKLPNMSTALAEFIELEEIEKIGEGSYGEAFKYKDMVVKIVPIEGARHVNGGPQKQASDVLGEVVISLMLSDLRRQEIGTCMNRTTGFAFTLDARICQGEYCPELIAEWNRWNEVFESENDPVDSFQKDQIFVVFVIENGGQDLSTFKLRDFNEAKSVLLQTILTCAVAEEALQFEHRDMHCGNVLLKRVPKKSTTSVVLRKQKIHIRNQGIEVVLIDFSLSRVGLDNGEVAYCDLNTDPEIFKGPKGDSQAEMYRRMKDTVQDQWADFCPKTNALWVHHLADVLLTSKIPLTDGEKRELRAFRKRALKADSCCDLVFDNLFSALWHLDAP